MGFDMQISGIDKKSVKKLSKILNISYSELLNKAFYDTYSPLYISITENGYNSLEEALIQNNLTMDEFSLMILNKSISITLNEIAPIAGASRNIFKDYFTENDIKDSNCGEYMILDKKLYLSMLNWLKVKLNSISVYKAFVEEAYDDFYINCMVIVCKQMEDWVDKIDWNNLLVYYEWDI